jgi:hypothetical protein
MKHVLEAASYFGISVTKVRLLIDSLNELIHNQWIGIIEDLNRDHDWITRVKKCTSRQHELIFQ